MPTAAEIFASDPGGYNPAGGVSAPTDISGNSFTDAIRKIADGITGAAQTYYGTQGALATAKANAQVAAATGDNRVQTARSGYPSPTLLTFGALGLVGVLLLTGRK